MHGTTALQGTTNVLIRCAALPLGPYKLGQLEIEVLPNLAKSGTIAPQMVVDHVRFVNLDHALKMHANNARVIGSITRKYVDDPLTHLTNIQSGFIDKRIHDIEETCGQDIGPYPLPAVIDGVKLILKASFIAYSMGMLLGPGNETYEGD